MSLEECRKKIDVIDAELIRLFEERLKVAAEIGREKSRNGIPIRDLDRETEKLERVESQSQPFAAEYNKKCFIEIMSVSRSYQESIIYGKGKEK